MDYNIGINNSTRISNLYNTNRKETQVYASDKSVKKDELNLSSQAKDYQLVRHALSLIPDVREAKIEELKAKIESGNYDINPDDIANKLLNLS